MFSKVFVKCEKCGDVERRKKTIKLPPNTPREAGSPWGVCSVADCGGFMRRQPKIPWWVDLEHQVSTSFKY